MEKKYSGENDSARNIDNNFLLEIVFVGGNCDSNGEFLIISVEIISSNLSDDEK